MPVRRNSGRYGCSDLVSFVSPAKAGAKLIKNLDPGQPIPTPTPPFP